MVREYDGTQMDLTAFRSLTVLRISSVLLLGNVKCMVDSPNADITALMLLNLTDLCIYFDTMQGVFHSMRCLESSHFV